MVNYYYEASIGEFHSRTREEIIGQISIANQFDSNKYQTTSWVDQIEILKSCLDGHSGTILFEFSIPRMGKRIDAVVIINGVVFVIEFKVGETDFQNYQLTQVCDYALDLKNFHKPSQKLIIAPILVATEAKSSPVTILMTSHNDGLIHPIKSNKNDLGKVITEVLGHFRSQAKIDAAQYVAGSYSPTPTIVEAAISLYNSHSVENITRSDATAKNLSETTTAISRIIDLAKESQTKRICFVTGVPGAGKTLVGLKVATSQLDKEGGNKSVYLSGNGPLVAVLQEALARDQVSKGNQHGKKVTKVQAKESVKAFLQNIHHYRDAYLVDKKPPYDHVAIFDEAQRAWTKEQTVDFMRRKKGISDFDHSEPEFLISCLDRHKDWAVVVCLVGGGQEINTGEAGISEWLSAVKNYFPQWHVHISPNLSDTEYAAVDAIEELKAKCELSFEPDLHLGVSLRSFRAENLSSFVRHLLERNQTETRNTLETLSGKYPIVLTRDLSKAKDWLREKARGSERYGLVASSQAERLKPLAIDVKTPMNPVMWFLNKKDDIRSSFYLEDAATEFHIQGLELDWVCVTWDGDLRFHPAEWQTFSFSGNKWKNIKKDTRKKYLVNAYRVLLTRARQGLVIVVPEGDSKDHTRVPAYYDGTYNYLKEVGLEVL